MISLATVIRTFIERGDYKSLRSHHDLIRTAGAHTLRSDDADQYSVLKCLLSYGEKYGRYPSFKELEEYASMSPLIGGNGQARMAWGKATRDLNENPDMGPTYAGSWEQLLDTFTQTGRVGMYGDALRAMNGMLSGAASDLPGFKITPDMPDAERIPIALKYFDHVRRKDFTLPSSAPEGGWRENAEVGADALLDGLQDTIKDRAYTGFSRIDSSVAIGPKQSIKYIGILGFSNHGKSMYMRTMAYNMAVSGKRILYIAREDTALNTWTQLSFLHSYKRPDLNIPPINVWRNQPDQVTETQQDNLIKLVDDLRHGTGVPGEIVVRTTPKWPDIVQELETGIDGQPFDVLMIDYLSHLDTGASGSKIHDEIRVLFKRAQAMAMDYKAGRGLVVVTPLQAGKKPMQDADAAEGEDWGIYHDLGAIDYYTDACRDMDLVISVWHKGALKEQAMMKVSCLKSREDFFPTHFLSIDRRTRMVLDVTGRGAISTHRPEMSRFKDPGLCDPMDLGEVHDISAYG